MPPSTTKTPILKGRSSRILSSQKGNTRQARLISFIKSFRFPGDEPSETPSTVPIIHPSGSLEPRPQIRDFDMNYPSIQELKTPPREEPVKEQTAGSPWKVVEDSLEISLLHSVPSQPQKSSTKQLQEKFLESYKTLSKNQQDELLKLLTDLSMPLKRVAYRDSIAYTRQSPNQQTNRPEKTIDVFTVGSFQRSTPGLKNFS